MSTTAEGLTISDRSGLADRILDAAQRIIVQTGARRLSLTEVAKLAGVARPTLYRYFATKEDLIDALGRREYRRFNTSMAVAISGKSAADRLEAAIDLIAKFLRVQPPHRLVDLEPGFVTEQMTRVLPMIEAAMAEVLERDLAGAIARIALSHYIFPVPDGTVAQRQLRAAAGLPAAGR